MLLHTHSGVKQTKSRQRNRPRCRHVSTFWGPNQKTHQRLVFGRNQQTGDTQRLTSPLKPRSPSLSLPIPETYLILPPICWLGQCRCIELHFLALVCTMWTTHDPALPQSLDPSVPSFGDPSATNLSCLFFHLHKHQPGRVWHLHVLGQDTHQIIPGVDPCWRERTFSITHRKGSDHPFVLTVCKITWMLRTMLNQNYDTLIPAN
jgi:hypothetical protein